MNTSSKVPSVRIGTNPIAWSNDAMPELGGETPLNTCLQQAALAGFTGIEMGGKFPREPKALASVLARFKLSLISGWYSANLVDNSVEQEWAQLEPHIDLLCSQGCSVLVFAETWQESFMETYRPMSTRPTLAADRFAQYGHKLSDLADKCLEKGIRLAVHHHIGSVIESQQDVIDLMHNTRESVGLLLDTGHAVSCGVDPLVVIQEFGSRICHVHCKDIRKPQWEIAKAKDQGFMESVLEGMFTVPGDGFIDYPAILAALNQAAYSGWLVVEAEQDPEKADPFVYAQKGYQYLARQAELAGFCIDYSA
jgi:inosose dehydratase